MGTVYHPDPNSDTPRGNARMAIVNTTNATPIKVKVTAHGYATGDAVEVEGAADPNADGTWLITYVDADHFTLDGSVGTLAGGAAGTVSNWTTLPFATMADDGDPVDSVTLMSPVENVNNFIPYATQRLGRWRCVDTYYAVHNDAGGVLADTAWSTTNLPGTNVWVRAQNNPLLTYSVAPYAVQGDLFDVTLTTRYVQTAGANAIPIAAAFMGPGGYVYKLTGSQFLLPLNYVGPVTVRGILSAAITTTTTGLFNFGFALFDLPAGGAVDLRGDWQCIVRHLRANP